MDVCGWLAEGVRGRRVAAGGGAKKKRNRNDDKGETEGEAAAAAVTRADERKKGGARHRHLRTPERLTGQVRKRKRRSDGGEAAARPRQVLMPISCSVADGRLVA